MNLSSTVKNQLLSAGHYDFVLPKEQIAQYPLPNREDARLLVVNRRASAFEHQQVRDMDLILSPGDCLVLNDTRVIPAQLAGQRVATGGRWLGLVVESDDEHWKLLAKTRGRVQAGERVLLHDSDGKPRIELVLAGRTDDRCWIGKPLNSSGNTLDVALQDLPLAEILQRIGRVPLPHYIRGGNMVDSDVADYQTVYAKHAGSIAAPTAGLHFTSPLLRRIIDRGVRIAAVTLHVGLGTFRPLECDDIDQHTMHAEHGVISESAAEIINETRSAGGRVIAVGTTTARILESATRQNRILPWNGSTDLFIKPGFQFQIVDGLLTNFHLPRTTLLVLVRTFGGDDLIRRAYEEAIREKYRFFSYGDAMLIL